MKLIKAAVIGLVLIIGIMIAFPLLTSKLETYESTQKHTRQRNKPTPIKKEIEVKKIDPELQQERLDFIRKMGSKGLFCKDISVSNRVGKIHITDTFLDLSEKDMNTILQVPFAYVYDEIGESDIQFAAPLILKVDNGTVNGKRVGEYKPIEGVKFYK